MSRTRWWLLPVFVITWLLVVRGVTPNGDDIAHIAGQIRFDRYVPVLGSHWIPNRVLDMYGRTLLTQVFELLYWPAHRLSGCSFFSFYQVFSAMIHAAFVTLCAWVLDRAATPRGFVIGREVLLLSRSLLVTALLVLLPWKNQVHVMAYQLPALLAFLTLLLLNRQLYAWQQGGSDQPRNVLMTLLVMYVSAFSLEAYSLLALMVSLYFCVIVWREVRGSSVSEGLIKLRRPAPWLLLTFMACNGLALVLVKWYSERAKVGHADGARVAPHLSGLLEGHLSWSLGQGVFFTAMGVLGMVWWMAREWQERAGIRPPLAHKSSGVMLVPFKPEAFLVLVTSLASLVMVQVVSRASGYDYFSHHLYPWGDLLLVGKFMLLGWAYGWLIRLDQAPWGARCFIALSGFVTMTHFWVVLLESGAADQRFAQRVEAAYFNAVNSDAPWVDTGLNLAMIPAQTQPLPTEHSPDWFVQGYRYLFQTYYGKSRPVLFR
jgi:hypothetical protein